MADVLNLSEKQKLLLSYVYKGDKENVIEFLENNKECDITFTDQQILYTALMESKIDILIILLNDKQFDISFENFEIIRNTVYSSFGFSDKTQIEQLNTIFSVKHVFDSLTIIFLKNFLNQLKNDQCSEKIVDLINKILQKKLTSKVSNF